MEIKKNNKSEMTNNASVKNVKPETEILMNDIRDFTEKLSDEKKNLLDDTYEEVTRLTHDLENLKLQNEELEIVINNMIKKNNQLEDSRQVLSDTYNTLLQRYAETRKLLHDSHNQNLELSKILQKMRDNEKCLVAETHKLRKYGSLNESCNQKEFVQMDSVANLEKEVKFWQREAEKLSEIIELNENKFTPKTSKSIHSEKKNNKRMKRYSKVVPRSHSVEESQRKSKEIEFEKLKVEKVQMKNLLNNLERQVIEIQNNVLKISDERQKYKDYYYNAKDQLEKNENLNVNMERRICDMTNENSKLSCENRKLSEDLTKKIHDNSQLKIAKINFEKEIPKIKLQYENEKKNLESKLSSLVKENHDIGVRSNNLKSSIISLECDFKAMEEELERKSEQGKEYLDIIGKLETELTTMRHQFNEKTESLDNTIKRACSLEESLLNLKNSEGLLNEKLQIKSREISESKKREKEKEEFTNKLKTSFGAQVVKLEFQLQNAEQIISSKIKLITSLELKISNYDQELKFKEEDILNLKKTLNSKEHELDIMAHKLSEANEGKNYLEQHIENLSSNNEASKREILSLNEVIYEIKKAHEISKAEVKSLTETLNRKEDQMLIVESQNDRYEKEYPSKNEEIARNKKLISQLRNEIEQKESHIGSLLSILEDKEEKLVLVQSKNEEKEVKIKEYIDQLRSFDDCTIQSTARNNALEKEIENLQNDSSRLSRQKEHLSQMLSSRNKTIGQLQAQLADKNEGRYLENISTIKDFPEINDFQNRDNRPHSPLKVQSRRRDNAQRYDNNETDYPIHHDKKLKPDFMSLQQANSLADHYDEKALRNRTQSHQGRQKCIQNEI